MSSVARIVVISQWNNLSNQTMNKTICFSSEKTERKREREPEGERDFINLLISPKKKKKKSSCEFKLDDHNWAAVCFFFLNMQF